MSNREQQGPCTHLLHQEERVCLHDRVGPANRECTTPRNHPSAAYISTILLSRSRPFTFAPRLNSVCTTPRNPPSAAQISAVLPSPSRPITSAPRFNSDCTASPSSVSAALAISVVLCPSILTVTQEHNDIAFGQAQISCRSLKTSGRIIDAMPLKAKGLTSRPYFHLHWSC